jgi:target of rapamycin complex subunit LST8
MLTNMNETTLRPIAKFTAHQTFITRVLLSPDVRHLATCSADHTARIWLVDPNIGLDDRGANMTPPSSSDSDDKENQTPPTFDLAYTLDNHQRWVWDCAWSADSAYLVTACSDHYARLWELASQSIIRQYNGHHRGAVCVALNDTAHPG